MDRNDSKTKHASILVMGTTGTPSANLAPGLAATQTLALGQATKITLGSGRYWFESSGKPVMPDRP